MRHYTSTYLKFIVWTLLFSFLITSCIEPIEIETENFEDLLVIEALLTTENKKHQIRLSRSFAFEDSTAVKESGASVSIQDNMNQTFIFEEASPGVYESIESFAPGLNNQYQLRVTTSSNRSYTSNFIRPTPPFVLDNLYAERIINDNDAFGLGIFVDSENSPNQNVFLKYEFDETFKLIAPFWAEVTAIPSTNESGFEVIPKEDINDRICYRTESLKDILLTNTENQSVNTVKRFQVKFINVRDPRLRTRYSINVKQINLSRDTYRFFELLSKLSDPDNIFSQLQPGFVEGNLVSETNPDEKVIGYFSIASVSEKRIFINFEDFFPDEPIPNYIRDCSFDDLRPNLPELRRALEEALDEDRGLLISSIRENLEAQIPVLIRNERLRFYSIGELSFENTIVRSNIPIYTPEECGDCRIFGSNVKPDFWVD